MIRNLIYGTWRGVWDNNLNKETNINKESCFKLLETAYASGIRIYDTSEFYGNGYAETILGTYSANNWPRESYEIISKIQGDRSPDQIEYYLRKSLERLNVECLDCYMLHWFTEYTDVKSTLHTFLDLKEKGYIRKIGICNCTYKQLRYCYQILANQLDSVQLEYNFVQRNNGKIPFVQDIILPFCHQKGIDFLAYNPFAPILAQKPEEIIKLSDKYNKSSCQLAIKWLLYQKVKVLIGTSNVEHLVQDVDINFDISEWKPL